MENLCVSPQCDFSSTQHGDLMSIEQQKTKLKLCVDVVQEVWGWA